MPPVSCRDATCHAAIIMLRHAMVFIRFSCFSPDILMPLSPCRFRYAMPLFHTPLFSRFVFGAATFSIGAATMLAAFIERHY